MGKNKLREIREKRALSQKELSDLTNVSQAQICRYEKNQGLSEESIRKFCIALECNADYLIGLVDDEPVEKKNEQYTSISYKEYYIEWYKKIPEEEAEDINEDFHILNDVVHDPKFLSSNNFSENKYMLKVLCQNLDVDTDSILYIFEDSWKDYEENHKFPFSIIESQCSNGLFSFKVCPKINLSKIELYVKVFYKEDILLFDASFGNASFFHKGSDYISFFWFISDFDPCDFDLDFIDNCDRQIGIKYFFLTKEEYEKSPGKRIEETDFLNRVK